MEQDSYYEKNYAIFCVSVYPELADEFWYAVRKLNGVNQVWEQERE